MTKYISHNGQHWRLRDDGSFLSFCEFKDGRWSQYDAEQTQLAGPAVALLASTGMATVSETDPTGTDDRERLDRSKSDDIALARYE